MSDLQVRPEPEDSRVRSRRRVRTLQDLLVFQIKLLLEGFKDLVLGPLSLGAAVLDFLLAKKAPDRYLDGVMRIGRRYEDALDLYGALDALDDPAGSGERGAELRSPDSLAPPPQISSIGPDPRGG
ncbi:hypothetical protein [Enhygromyxa salina]|uniref:Uncharacterized protein n=1 Tax=Enhygromyxa salina TaxID=215803 RepID=A0A2S9YMF9_9BACT|nr:hypothetical protein [Enhygromyxa salina]PRQ06279.1 hypothetical protein ENSA7_39560 [Enhygromyxa salina]